MKASALHQDARRTPTQQNMQTGLKALYVDYNRLDIALGM